MRPLFTVHAGEELVADYIERNHKNYRVWIPSKDTGVDLLVTNPISGKYAGLQVKFSRDFYTKEDPLWGKKVKSFGWWTLDANKIKLSDADLWVFVLFNFNERNSQYIILKPKELLKRLSKIHGDLHHYRLYFMLTDKNTCWEVRKLKKKEQTSIVDGKFKENRYDFTDCLDAWDKLDKLLK
jgi:hypothetical protein